MTYKQRKSYKRRSYSRKVKKLTTIVIVVSTNTNTMRRKNTRKSRARTGRKNGKWTVRLPVRYLMMRMGTATKPKLLLLLPPRWIRTRTRLPMQFGGPKLPTVRCCCSGPPPQISNSPRRKYPPTRSRNWQDSNENLYNPIIALWNIIPSHNRRH